METPANLILFICLLLPRSPLKLLISHILFLTTTKANTFLPVDKIDLLSDQYNPERKAGRWDEASITSSAGKEEVQSSHGNARLANLLMSVSIVVVKTRSWKLRQM